MEILAKNKRVVDVKYAEHFCHRKKLYAKYGCPACDLLKQLSNEGREYICTGGCGVEYIILEDDKDKETYFIWLSTRETQDIIGTIMRNFNIEKERIRILGEWQATVHGAYKTIKHQKIIWFEIKNKN